MANVNEKCRGEIINLLRNGKEVGEVISHVKRKYGVTYNAAQKRVMNVRKSMNPEANNPTKVTAVSQTEGMKSGEIKTQETSFDGKKNETTFTGLVALKPNQNVSKEYILEQYGLSPLEWSISSFKMSEWETAQKGGGTINLNAFKLGVVPKKNEDFTPQEVQTIICTCVEKVMKQFSGRVNQIVQSAFKVKNSKDGLIVEICLPDIHVGLLAWRMETGEDFDLNIVYQHVMHAVRKIYAKLVAMNINIQKIIIVSLGDVTHVDNDEQTTTKGTFQQVDGRFPKIIETAFNLMFDIITLFATLAPVEYIYIPGNHDKNTGWQLAFTLGKVFENVPNITCDCAPQAYKHRQFGQVAVGWTHGSMNKKNLDGLMNSMVRDQTNVYYKCLHVGHLHSSHSHTSVDGGCFVEHLDSVCPASLWEHEQGYGKTPLRYVKAFIWDGTPTPPDTIVGAVTSAKK